MKFIKDKVHVEILSQFSFFDLTDFTPQYALQCGKFVKLMFWVLLVLMETLWVKNEPKPCKSPHENATKK